MAEPITPRQFHEAAGIEAANHHPDVEPRPEGVTVRLTADEIDGLSRRDLELARQISRAGVVGAG